VPTSPVTIAKIMNIRISRMASPMFVPGDPLPKSLTMEL
jgi:hypothetical protein